MEHNKESEPDPRPEAQAESSGAASEARPSAQAYTAMPAPAERKKKPWLATLLVMAALGLGGAYLKTHSPAKGPPAPIPAAAQAREGKVFVVTSKDYDAPATQLAQQILKRDKTTHELAALSRGKAAAPVQGQSPEVLKAEQIKAELSAAPQALRDSIAEGKSGLYTFRFIELADEGGDVFDITVDGVPLCRVTTSPQLATLTIPLDPNVRHTITETLVYSRDRRVYVKMANPGAEDSSAGARSNQTHLSVASSQGEMRSRVMGPGDSDTWTVDIK